MPESQTHALASRDDLPAAAQRWLDRALPADLPQPGPVRIEQTGSMNVRDRWTDFTATGIYKAPPLSFEWRAKLKLMPGMWIQAEDGFREGEGWGGASLWGIIPMGKRTDQGVLTSQRVRCLGELALLPTLALVDTSLVWMDSGSDAFEVRSTQAGVEITVHFDVDANGDITRAHSPARPYDVPDGYEDAPWGYEFGDHREFSDRHEFGGPRLPRTVSAYFQMPQGRKEYFRAQITAMSRD